MRIDIITIFPKMVEVPLSESLIGRAREKGLFDINVFDLRDFAYDKHKIVDDIPYGGGPGMVLKPEPIMEAMRKVDPEHKAHRIATSAAGTVFSHDIATRLSNHDWLIILCGHYKGIDQRAIEMAGMEEISIGDYILTGGEYAAVVIADAVLRLLPRTMKDFGSAIEDSHADGILGAQEYTRPENYEGHMVPKALVSGHHENIRKWRLGNALYRTKSRRPDLFSKRELTDEEKSVLYEYESEIKRTESKHVGD